MARIAEYITDDERLRRWVRGRLKRGKDAPVKEAAKSLHMTHWETYDLARNTTGVHVDKGLAIGTPVGSYLLTLDVAAEGVSDEVS